METGTVRIGYKDLRPYHYTRSGWRRADADITCAIKAIKLFSAHHLKHELRDTKNPQFFKGQLSPEGKVQGARITILPDGTPVDKAYSLFARHLTVHDESSHDHWDVIFQNPGGTWSYVYSLEKKKKHVRQKYRKVQEFEKHYPRLRANVRKALHDERDQYCLPMYTLLKTCMRIGSEVYYKAHGHKGLSTLTKSDIRMSDNIVRFSYLSKGGVPRDITERFPPAYTERLKNALSSLKKGSYVFATPGGHPLSDLHFKQAFRKYCGKEFYPHIVRSFYATARVKQFLQGRKKASKEEVRHLFTSIAEKLGHRKFDKKEQVWKESYNITMNYYVQPEILERVKRITV